MFAAGGFFIYPLSMMRESSQAHKMRIVVRFIIGFVVMQIFMTIYGFYSGTPDQRTRQDNLPVTQPVTQNENPTP